VKLTTSRRHQLVCMQTSRRTVTSLTHSSYFVAFNLAQGKHSFTFAVNYECVNTRGNNSECFKYVRPFDRDLLGR
jgi:hypothetical protein